MNLARQSTNLLFLPRPVSQALVQLSLSMYISVNRYYLLSTLILSVSPFSIELWIRCSNL